ncbi:non-specific serine/threonine protein kinase [Malassezia yamatoensis]|uniref:non-specific serine/threonine protein kinase n=1 Tax=Malassezia yamatoensis TaxID=253288 RepID=A0AAJ5YPC8_9BASI|nr:non-specific serine/threonine protein kinase [Malassezia yamatoensis]
MAQASQQGSMAPFQGQRSLHPGTRVQVGSHVVTVQRFLSQGGFARVYLVRSDRPVELPNGEPTTELVLKHMCVWNRDALRSVRAEVENHRKLLGYTSIVHFVEASAANLEGHGWEIFILMEFSSGGGLIDFLNTRLQARLQPKEVLNIFRDICYGVSIMHEKQLVHRDLKIENILMSQGESLKFKLCDFGSCFSSRDARPALSLEEKRKMEAELNMHTTIWYRAPEMVDLNLEKKIDQRADVWALGVLLYKLCYYTTPFEGPQGGPTAILSARYTFPSSPPYPSELKSLIEPNLDKRPTVKVILTRIEELLKLDPSHKKSQTHRGVEVPLSSPVIRPLSANTRPTSSEVPARSSPVSQMPLSQSMHAKLTNNQSEATPKESELLKEVSERFPSLEELDSRANVRQLAANYDSKSTTKPSADMLSKPQRSLNSTPLTSEIGKQSLLNLHSGPIKRDARSQYSHTILGIDSSDDSDQEEAPEDPEAYVPFRKHKRDSVAIDMEPREMGQTRAQASGYQSDSARWNHDAKLAQPSDGSEDHGQQVESDSLRADKQQQLAELAEQERALEALLDPTMSSNNQDYNHAPLVEDLLGIEGISIRDRASIWENGPSLNTGDKSDQARIDKTSNPLESSRSSISETLKSDNQPQDSVLVDISEPELIPTSSNISDASRQNDGLRFGQESENEAISSPKSMDSTARVQSPMPTQKEDGNTISKTNKLPAPSRLRPQKAKPIKVAPDKEWSSAIGAQSTSPPLASAPIRSATWDVPQSSRSQRETPSESCPPRKKYVDASTSPVLPAQNGADSLNGTEIELLKNVPGVRERMNRLQTLNTRQDSNETQPTISMAENELQSRTSSKPSQNLVQRESLSNDQQNTIKPDHLESEREENETRSADVEPDHLKSQGQTSFSSSSTNELSRALSSESKVKKAAHSQNKEDVAMMLSKRAGQIRLTKRAVHEDAPVKPWEKEAQAARQLQGLKDVSRETDGEDESSPTDPPFAGVNALISRWQSHTPK